MVSLEKVSQRTASWALGLVKSLRRFVHERRRGVIPFLVVLAASIVSFWATFTGFVGITSTVFLSVLATLVIQLGLIWAVFKAKGSERFRTKVYWFAIYFMVMILSVGFGVSYWDHKLSALDRALEDYADQGEAVRGPLEEFASAFDSIDSALAELVTHSEQTAVIEERDGTSCGYQTAKIRGPRYRLRMSDRRILHSYQPWVSTASTKLVALIQQVQTVPFTLDGRMDAQETLRGVARQARAMARDTRLAQLRGWLEERTSTEMFEDNDVTFQCEDPVFDTFAANVVTAINGIPPVPDPTEIVIFDGSDPKESVRIVFDLIRSKVNSMLGITVPKSRGQLKNQRQQHIRTRPAPVTESLDTLPMVLGACIDLLILAFAAPMGRRQNGSDEMRWPADHLDQALTSLAAELRLSSRLIHFLGKIHSLSANLEASMTTIGKITYVHLPLKRLQDNPGQPLAWLMELAEQSGAAKRLHDGVEAERFFRPLRRGIFGFRSLATREVKGAVRVWEMKAHKARELRIFVRSLGLAVDPLHATVGTEEQAVLQNA